MNWYKKAQYLLYSDHESTPAANLEMDRILGDLSALGSGWERPDLVPFGKRIMDGQNNMGMHRQLLYAKYHHLSYQFLHHTNQHSFLVDNQTIPNYNPNHFPRSTHHSQ